MRIIHVTPHLGGGVGRVVLAWLGREAERATDEHLLLCLEDANPAARRRAAAIALRDRMDGSREEVLAAVAESDVVVIHWWNHPAMYDFLVNGELPPCRLVLWSHVAGFTAPHVLTRALVEHADRLVLATAHSLDAPAIRALPPELLGERVRVIASTAGVARAVDVEPVAHAGFNIGYIGTVDYCKLHPAFLAMSAAADIPDARFVVCGGEQHELLREEARRMGVGERFEFTGVVEDIVPRLATFDVFGYPLRDGHYGTGEQSIVEAMAAGLPVVTLGHGSERELVEHGRTGLVAKDDKEYTAALERLFRDPALRERLGREAKAAARARFSLDAMVASWRRVLEEVVQGPKRIRRWPSSRPLAGAALFVESLGDERGPFAVSLDGSDEATCVAAEREIAALDGAFRSSTRGSTFHYRSRFPEDPHLNLWCGLIERTTGDRAGASASFARATAIGRPRVAGYAALAREGSGQCGSC